MTNKDIQTLINKYLAGLTSPQEELQLTQALQQHNSLPAEWQAINLMLGELTQGEAAYDAIMGLSTNEIASQTGIPNPSITAMVSAARKKVFTELIKRMKQ